MRELRIDQNLIYGQKRYDVTIAFTVIRVKNRLSLEYIVPEDTAKLLERYIRDYRPLLACPEGPWLFPGEQIEKPKCYESMRQQIKRVMRNRGGLDFTPHTFRHASGYIILTDNPGAYGQVQRVLGHKSIQTTMTYYTGMERVAAVVHFDKTMQAKREQAEADGARQRPKPKNPKDV